jgi:hypothetical protein
MDQIKGVSTNVPNDNKIESEWVIVV